jgi:hypothetical protein
MDFAIFFLQTSCGPYLYHNIQTFKQSPPAEPHEGGRHTDDGVLPGALKGSFATLLSPPQCYAAFDTMPHTSSAVKQSPVCRPKTLSLSAKRMRSVGFYRGTFIEPNSITQELGFLYNLRRLLLLLMKPCTMILVQLK